MTEATAHPPGLVTEAEGETLTDPDADDAARNAVRDRVRERLRAALEDCQVLYPTLREADIDAVFCPDDDTELAAVRAATQDAVGVLVLGMLANDDLVETRIADAVRYAGLAAGEEVTVTVELRRGPVPTPEECLARIEADGITAETLLLYEHLLWNDDATPQQVAAVDRRVGMDTAADDVRDARETAAWCTRPPQTAVVSVAVETGDEEGSI